MKEYLLHIIRNGEDGNIYPCFGVEQKRKQTFKFCLIIFNWKNKLCHPSYHIISLLLYDNIYLFIVHLTKKFSIVRFLAGYLFMFLTGFTLSYVYPSQPQNWIYKHLLFIVIAGVRLDHTSRWFHTTFSSCVSPQSFKLSLRSSLEVSLIFSLILNVVVSSIFSFIFSLVVSSIFSLILFLMLPMNNFLKLK